MLTRTAFAIALVASAMPCYAAETQAERQACTNDATIHCADEIPDRERVYACLIQNVAVLSPACKKIISDSIAPAPPPRRPRGR
jgi:hypothetical protein